MARLHTQFLKTSAPVSLTEQDIDHYITAHVDGNYDKALANDNRWSVFYHLSDMREGLFGWYDMPPEADVLELDCGFGALSGVLADHAAHVTALTDSLFCARACAKRWKEKENLDVYAGRLHDMPFRQQFDIITLVDVLPKIAGGETSLAPYADYLRSLLYYLKPQGRLLLAMDNRLGLKYVCGALDPYSEEPFGELSGIVGKGRLFTKPEIIEILSAAGFTHWKFYYPLPDYRLPQFIFTDAALPEPSLVEMMIPYDPTPDARVLPEGALYTDFVQNGLFPAMTNSFLVECAMQEDFCGTELASLAFDRIPEYSVATCREGNHYIKKAIVKTAQQSLQTIAEHLEALRERGLDVVPCELSEDRLTMPYIKAPTLAAWLKTASSENRDAVLEAMERLWAAILQSSPPVPNAENTMRRLSPHAEWGVILRRAYLNMTPDNVFYQDGNLTFFNQGLCWENCPAKYQIFLAIYDNMDILERIGVLTEMKERYGLSSLWPVLEATQEEHIAHFCRSDTYHRFYDWTGMSPMRMLKNRQILKIIGNEDEE